jgi:hypothetical protein
MQFYYKSSVQYPFGKKYEASIQMNKLISSIKTYEFLAPVTEYHWVVPESPVLIPDGSAYEGYIFFRSRLSEKMKNDLSLDIHYWIIQHWDEGQFFERNDMNDQLIHKFLGGLASGRKALEADEILNIASFSKLAAFFDPTQYAIYDFSRVYPLNWLIFRNSIARIIFPQPKPALGSFSARAYDLSTLFRLSGLDFSEHQEKYAYHIYCQLLTKIAEAVYSKPAMPCMVEMMLNIMSIENYVNLDIEETFNITLNPAFDFEDESI